MRLKQVLEHPEGWRKWRAAAFYQSHPVQLRGRLRQLCGAAAQHVGNFPLIDKACARLQKVVVENRRFLRSSSGSMTDR